MKILPIYLSILLNGCATKSSILQSDFQKKKKRSVKYNINRTTQYKKFTVGIEERRSGGGWLSAGRLDESKNDRVTHIIYYYYYYSDIFE